MLQILENDVVRMMSVLVIQIGLSYPIRNIKNYNVRFFYSLFMGTLLQFLVYGVHTVRILLFSLLIYVIIQVRVPLISSNIGAIVTTLSMAFLSAYHLSAIVYRYGEETMDQIVLLMLLVCKYSLFAYAVQDGRKSKLSSKQNIKQNNQIKEQKQNQATLKKQKYYIFEYINLLKYLGYLQFLPTSVMGPPIQYKIYQEFIQKKGIFKGQLPSRKPIMLQTLKQFLICCFFFAIGMIYFPISYMKTQQFYTYSSAYIFLYTIISITLFRFKFYSAWKIGISSIHSSGLSYNPQTKTYTAMDHCRAFIVQKTPQVKQKIANWNMMVQEWLRKSIYERVQAKSRFLRQLAVFMTSAFWHGFYGGYYITFFLWFGQLYIQGQIYKLKKNNRNPQQQSSNKLSDRLLKILTQYQFLIGIVCNLLFTHNATFFALLQISLCIKLMIRVYFIPQLIILIGIVLILLNKATSKKRISNQMKQKPSGEKLPLIQNRQKAI